MEGAVRNRGISSQFPHLSSLGCPSSPNQSQPVVQRRPHVPTVSISNQPEVYLGRLPVTRPLHLAAQPCIEVPGSQPRD